MFITLCFYSWCWNARTRSGTSSKTRMEARGWRWPVRNFILQQDFHMWNESNQKRHDSNFVFPAFRITCVFFGVTLLKDKHGYVSLLDRGWYRLLENANVWCSKEEPGKFQRFCVSVCACVCVCLKVSSCDRVFWILLCRYSKVMKPTRNAWNSNGWVLKISNCHIKNQHAYLTDLKLWRKETFIYDVSQWQKLWKTLYFWDTGKKYIYIEKGKRITALLLSQNMLLSLFLNLISGWFY